MKRIKRLFLRVASSFALNFIMAIIIFIFAIIGIGGVVAWRLLSIYLVSSVLFLNANYFPYIKHRFNL